jgi:hypothetical protein
MGSQIDIVMMKKEMTTTRPKTDSLTGYFMIAAAVFVFEKLVRGFDLAMPVLPGCFPLNPRRSPSKRI